MVPVERVHQVEPSWLKLAPSVFVFLWSTGVVGAKYGLPYAEPFTLLALRFALSGVLLAVLAWFIGNRWPTRREALHSIVSGIFMHGIYLAAVFWVIAKGMPAGIAALIVGLQPLITAQMARLIGERISWRNWIGLVVGLFGVAIVIAPRLNLADQGVSLIGVLVVLGGIISISAGSIYQKRFGSGTSLLAGTAWQFFGAFIVVFIGACLFESFVVDPTMELLLTLAWMVLVLSIGAVSLLTLLIKHGNVSKLAGMFYLVPGVTAVMTYFLFGEDLTPVQIFGMVVCMAGVSLASKPSRAA